jgi:outer membrane protein insertion porin family
MGATQPRFQLKLIAGAAAVMWLPAAFAFTPFTVKEIRAQGLQRLEIGTVLTYLPLSVGDQVNDQTSRQAMRALYGSGLFDDVSLERDGDALVIKVKERPAISGFKIDGNEKIGGDDLKKSLTEAGLAEGELFKRDLLEQVSQELQRQYFANGYYDVEINTEVKQEPNNRVNLEIKVIEGKVTKIKDINLIGNHAFTKEELLEAFKLKRTNWVPFQKTDKYSKQQLVGDLESLTSYYQDRGYLKANINSVQVQLSPDKKDIYITANVEEGQIYTIKDARFSGETILQTDFLARLLSTKAGDTFSRKQATESADRIEAALSDIGYAFADVTPLPEVDEAKREVSLNYVVQPGKRTYVRRVNFTGHGDTHDETLRREMRQLEAAPFSKSSVERSRVRLARLPFVEEAEVDTQPVAGTDDLVDVNFKIKERAPGSVQFGVGYSGSAGFLITGSLTHTNFLGTGNRVSLEANRSQISKVLNLSWTDPYFTSDGISQTASVFYRKSESVIRFSSGFNSNIVGFNLTYGIPLSEYTSLRAGFGIEQTALEAFPNSTSDEVLQFMRDNGSRFNTYQLRTGIARDTRNKTFFATSGSLQQFFVDASVPGSSLNYYSATYHGEQYVPLPYKFVFTTTANVGIVDDYGSGSKSEVPPYEYLFAGGAKTVRGYDDGTLGPRDTPFDNPLGGKVRGTLQNELIIPLPVESDQKSTRLSLFYDVGQVYAAPRDVDLGDLRTSAGVAFEWFTPFLGLLQLSYAFPLNDVPSDDVKRFQITFGSGF